MIQVRTLSSGRRVLPQEMPAARVWNKRDEDYPRDGALIDRHTKWGNPFRLGRDGTRDEIVDRYALYLSGQPELVEQARAELAGRDLICWCYPERCHGDVLFAAANDGAIAPK